MNNNTKKPKLLIILGAGSSQPFGMPAVSHLNKKMLVWSKNWINQCPTNSEFNPYKCLWKVSDRYYRLDSHHDEVYPNYGRLYT